tara:strand:+ start:3646 stop:4716 length:1071 start_codon:yes stop_codon:yes gene_type:complete
MKILFLNESLRPGGKERRLSSLIMHLCNNNDVQVELILFIQEIHYELPKSTNFKIHFVKRKRKKDFSAILKIYKIASKFKPHLVNPWGVMPAFYSILLKYIFKIPLINSQIVGAPIKVSFGWHNITLFFSDLIIANSQAGLKAYNVNSKNRMVIYNGFNFKRLDNLTNSNFIREKYNLSNYFIIGMVASFSTSKDYDTFLKSAELILSKYNNIKFICIGDGDKSKYKNNVKNDFHEKIIFLDVIKEIESLINIFDIGVLSTFSEGISNSIMEYMALGKPVIATDAGGTSELINDSESGFLIKQKNPKILAEKIETLYKNQKLRSKMGRNGIEIIKNKFRFDLMYNSYYNIFKLYCN